MKIKSNSGSVLVVAAGFSLLLAAGAAAYLFLAMGVYKRTARSFYYNSSANIAEAGVEQALWALNHTGNWSANTLWQTVNTNNKLLSGSAAAPMFVDANGMKAYYNVFVENFNSTSPTITAESVIKFPSAAPIRKQIRIFTATTNLFIPPLVALNDLTLKGGIYDSYTKADGPTTTTHRYNTTVGSLSVTLGDALVNSNATIYGHVEVGIAQANSSSFVNGVKGAVLASGTAAGQPGVVKSGGNLVDTNQISYDFDQDYPAPTYPSDYGTVVTALPAADAAGNIVLGTAGAVTPTLYDITGNVDKPSIVIVGPVYLKVSGSLKLTGNDAISVVKTTSTSGTVTYTGSSTAKLGIYALGDIDIKGNGKVTADDPTAISISGMSDVNGAQTINIGGNGSFVGTVYAPRANLVFNGGGSKGYFAGAAIAYNVTVTGSKYDVRYPEELANAATGKTFSLAKWVELTDPATWHSF